MTREDRNIKLKHLITCMKCEVSGKVCDENCSTQYEAGNIEEIIENLKAISEILVQQHCEDCVSRERTMLRVREFIGNPTYTEKMLVDDLNALPSVTPKEKTGQWETLACDLYMCSKCYDKYTFKSNYCPNCGARMIETQGK